MLSQALADIPLEELLKAEAEKVAKSNTSKAVPKPAKKERRGRRASVTADTPMVDRPEPVERNDEEIDVAMTLAGMGGKRGA